MYSNITDQLLNLRFELRTVAAGDTAFDNESWQKLKETCPLNGHCYIVALIVQELHGGKLVRGVFEDSSISHYWNQLPSGIEVDLTGDQYGGDGFNPVINGVVKDEVFPKPYDLTRLEIMKNRLSAWKSLDFQERFRLHLIKSAQEEYYDRQN